jgi:hypothetical protein
MPIDDPTTWLKTATAIKTMFDGVRSAVGAPDFDCLTCKGYNKTSACRDAL